MWRRKRGSKTPTPQPTQQSPTRDRGDAPSSSPWIGLATGTVLAATLVGLIVSRFLVGPAARIPTITTATTPPATTTLATTTLATTTKATRGPPTTRPRVTLALQDGDVVVCSMTSNGATCPIHGTAKASPGMEVLLWVELVHPRAAASPDYYIQRGPVAGVTRQPQPGTSSPWEGAIQIGNTQYPACRGDTLNIIATLARASVAVSLLGNAQQAYPDPTGANALTYSQADNVRVSGVPACHH